MRQFLGLAILGLAGWYIARRSQGASTQAPSWLYDSYTEGGATSTAGDNAAASAGGNAIVNAPRGIRNNNPGNLRGGGVWLGLAIPSVDDQGYLIFTSPYYGLRALAIDLKNQQTKHGLRTVRAIITKYAPPSENLTGAYVDAVAKAMAVGPDQPIDLSNSVLLAQMVAAVVEHENGIQPYSIAEIQSAAESFSFG